MPAFCDSRMNLRDRFVTLIAESRGHVTGAEEALGIDQNPAHSGK
jgi:hypothetical protein